MNDKELTELMNNVDNELIDQKIDDLLEKNGNSADCSSIKEKAMKKLDHKQMKKMKLQKRYVLAASIAATLMVSTVYAKEISAVIQSFFHKSVVNETVVDGDAYYLPQEMKLNDKFTLLDVMVSKDHLDMSVKLNEALGEKETDSLDVSIVPADNDKVRYTVGGYGYGSEGELEFSFMNAVENNYNIAPFQEFVLTIGDASYNVSLAKAEALNTDERLNIGTSPEAEQVPLIANVAGSSAKRMEETDIQLVASFEDKDLKLKALGEPEFSEFSHKIENDGEMVLSAGTGGVTKPILAYDKSNTAYPLTEPKDAVGRPITRFETTASADTDLTVKLPAICVGYEKDVTQLSLQIPKEGEVTINKELDFLIQTVNVKSIKRTSDTTAVVEFALNTGKDKNVFITDLGAYSKDVIQAETKINGNTATMTMTFEKGTDNVDFDFSWPNYVIQGNWEISLGAAE